MTDDHVRDVSKRRILIIDDSPDDLALLFKILAARGHQIHPATTGEAALRFLDSTLCDLILLDVTMPRMNGYEVCKQLKANPRTADIPVIFISANEVSAAKVKAFTYGGVDYIVKPFRQDEVVARIDTHLLLRDLQENLSLQVQRRTAELAATNVRLQAEMAERERAQEALRLSEERFRSLYHGTPSTYLMVDPQGILRLINRFGLAQLGYESDDVVNQPMLNLIHPDEQTITRVHLQKCMEDPGQVFHWESRILRNDGGALWTRQAGRAMHEPDGSLALLVVCEDVSERKRAEERVQYLAHHDPLTGLPNRLLMEDRVQQCMMYAQRLQSSIAMLFLDLDGFKHINDSLGHPAGDALLREVAKRLQGCLQDGDSIAQLGGDEFIFILSSPADSQRAAATAQAILEVLDKEFSIGGHSVHVTGSVGISIYPGDGTSVEALLRSADTAMYHAKSRGRNNFQFFTSVLNEAAQQRRKTETLLRKAMQDGEFELHYQPQVDMATGAVIAAEALLRWRRADQQPVSCADFIGVAEDSGLIVALGMWVLSEACAQLHQWRRKEFPRMRVAVNISARQFSQPRFFEAVMKVLDDHELPPDALELEITESAFIQNDEESVALLKRFRAAGIQLALDDFGTGYSSLSYLQRFPVNVLKIDRSFINGLGEDKSQTALVTAIIAMGRSLGLQVIAEGVERLDQAAFLLEQGCQCAQGYYYARPLPALAFAELLRDAPSLPGTERGGSSGMLHGVPHLQVQFGRIANQT